MPIGGMFVLFLILISIYVPNIMRENAELEATYSSTFETDEAVDVMGINKTQAELSVSLSSDAQSSLEHISTLSSLTAHSAEETKEQVDRLKSVVDETSHFTDSFKINK